MIFKNSRLLVITLLPISLILLVTLVDTIYDIRAKNNETSRLLNLASETDEAKIRAQATRNLRREAEEDLEAFENLVLSEDRFISLIETIEEAGRALNADAKVISIAKVEEKTAGESKMIRVVMEAEGLWAGVFTFLKALESMPYRVIVEESSVSKVDLEWHSRIVLLLNSFD